MSGVDENVVKMTFDNEAFESKLSNTLASLDKLTQSLKLNGAEQGFRNVSAAADSVNLSSMAGALDNISGKFSAMGAIGFSVISNLTTGVLEFAKTAAEKVLDPLMTGGRQRAINLDNARFAFQGLGIDVNAAMDSALSAVKGTAFGLDEAAKAAAQFGASGIAAGDGMTQSLRAIAGIAAMSNSAFSDISAIMTKAAANNKVTNIDFEQFATRGLNAAAAYAKATGKTEAQVHEMATKGQIDYASFAKAMDDTFGAHAQEADKTFSGALGNMHAALSRLGAAFYIPQLENQRKLLNAFSPIIDGIKTSFQPVIDMFTFFTNIKTDKIVNFLGSLDFTKLKEPMKNFADAFTNIMTAIQAFVTPIKTAFNEIFPINAVATLMHISDIVENFTAKLKINSTTAMEVQRVFVGIFSIFDIVGAVVKELIGTIFGLVGAFSGAGGGILSFSAGLGDTLSRLDNFLVKGGALHRFFLTLREDVQAPIEFLKNLAAAISAAFQSFSSSDVATNSIGRMNARIDETEAGISRVQAAWDTFTEHMSGVFNVLGKVWDYISNWFGTLGQKISAAFHPGDFDSAVDIVNVGLIGGLTLMFKKFMQGGVDNIFASGTVAKVKAMLSGVTTTLHAMQTDLKADALVKIAAALAVLAASLVVLSLIDSAALTKALTAMAVSFGELVGVMTLIDKLVSSNTAAIKLGIIGAALIEFSIAAGILTLAIRNLSGLSWNELVKGLAGVAGALIVMVGATKLMGEGNAGMIASGVGMTAMSVGLIALSVAVKEFSKLGWAEMAKGLAGIAGGLLLITLAMNEMPATGAISGIGLIEIAAGLVILSQAVKMFGSMDWGELGKGLLGIAGALIVVVAALLVLPPDAPLTAAGLLIVASALVVMGEAIKVIGGLDIGTLAKGIGGIAAVMLILALALNAMDGALPGAAALVVAAAALGVLTEVMEKLGAMKAGDIVKSLLALAGVLTVLGIAGLLMEPVIPGLLALGAAVALIGGGFALFGAGVWLVAKGLEALAATGVAGAKAFVEILKTVGTAIPELIGAVLQSIITQGDDLLKAVPLLIRLVTAVFDQLLDTIIQLAPKLAKALIEVAKSALSLIQQEFPEFVKTGMLMLLSLLQGIRDNIGQIVTVVADIIVNFINALRKKVPEMVDAWFNFMLTVFTSLAEKLGESVFIFVPIGEAFMNGVLTGLNNAVKGIFDFFTGLPGRLLDIVKSGLGIDSPSTKFMEIGVNIILGLLNGLTTAIGDVINWFTNLPSNILGWIGDIAGLELVGIQFVANFLSGIITGAIDLETWWIGLVGKILGWIGDVTTSLLGKGIEILAGFLSGIIQKEIDVMNWWIGLPGKILGWLGDLVGLEVKGIEAIAHFLTGIVNKAIDLAAWFIGLSGMILGWIGDVSGKLASKGIEIIGGFFGGILQKIADVVSWFQSLPDQIIGWIGDLAGKLKDIGYNAIVGLMNGILDAIPGAKAVTEGAAGSIAGAFQKINQSKSPSKLYHGFGIDMIQGLINGIKSMILPATSTTSSLAEEMAKKMNDAFSQVAMSMNEMGDLQPTITPVLDLTNVKMGANDLTNMFNGIAIAPTVSFEQARTISTTADLAKTSTGETPLPTPTEITFNQYNTSPNALTTNDIYRNTKNQIATAKEELSI